MFVDCREQIRRAKWQTESKEENEGGERERVCVCVCEREGKQNGKRV